LVKFQKLDAILAEQERIKDELASEIAALRKDDLFAEIEGLRRQVAELSELKSSLSDKNGSLTEENKRLRNTLYEQLFNEKASLVTLSDNRLNAYFASEIKGRVNRLSFFESSIKQQIDQLAGRIEQERTELQSTACTELFKLKLSVECEISDIRQKAAQSEYELLEQKDEGIRQLKDEPLSEEAIARRGKQNNFEALLGLKLFNKLGIILIIIGVIAAARFTYVHIPDTMKAVLIYLLGIAMLTCGEWLNRKKPDVFSLGLTSGGVAVLYIATAVSFFLFEIISVYPALTLCILTTVLSFFLSRRYDSQTIAVFALIGGYLPLFSIGTNAALVYFALGYFIILNVFALSAASLNRWRITQFVGFALNTISTAYIVSLLYEHSRDSDPVAILYVFFSFVVYTAIPIISSLKTDKHLKTPDITLLSLNTFFGSAIMFIVFASYSIFDYAGLMALGFSVFYFTAAKMLELYMLDEKSCRALFYITGLTFAVLFVPLQFDVAYISLGWLIEGVLLLSYGIYKGLKPFKIAGWVISALCLFVFIVLDLPMGGPLFFYKYLFITFGSLLILAAMFYKKRPTDIGTTIYKCAAAINLWIFLLYAIGGEVRELLYRSGAFNHLYSYLLEALLVTISLVYAYLLMRIKPLASKSMQWVTIGIYAIGLIGLIMLNSAKWYAPTGMYLPQIDINSTPLYIIGTAILVTTNLLAIFAMRDLILRLTLKRKLGVEWYPLALSAFFVFLFMQNLIVMFDLAANNIILTAIFALTALGWILFGFIKRYLYIRLSGLGLSFITVIKLFIIDLGFLGEGMRIASYFAMGVVLLAISFVYQHFNKKLGE